MGPRTSQGEGGFRWGGWVKVRVSGLGANVGSPGKPLFKMKGFERRKEGTHYGGVSKGHIPSHTAKGSRSNFHHNFSTKPCSKLSANQDQ